MFDEFFKLDEVPEFSKEVLSRLLAYVLSKVRARLVVERRRGVTITGKQTLKEQRVAASLEIRFTKGFVEVWHPVLIPRSSQRVLKQLFASATQNILRLCRKE